MLESEAAQARTPWRLWLIPLILAIETTAVVQVPHPWFTIYLYRGVPVFFGLTLLFFGRVELRRIGEMTFSTTGAAVHVAALTSLAVVELFLLAIRRGVAGPTYVVVADAWLLLLLSLVPTLLVTFFPLKKVLDTARRLGAAWVYAAVCSTVLVIVRELLRESWEDGGRVGTFLQSTAFNGSRHLLGLLYPHIIHDASSQLLGTARFQILIGSTCSGVQGLALLSVLMVAWYCFARRHLRPARVLLLGCFALATMWALNIVRLVALIAIGDAGHPRVAMNGFHSEAGWIALIVVTLGLLLTTERISWFRRPNSLGSGANASASSETPARTLRNVPAMYLLPFLAITGASVLSQAVSGGFEWLYPIRLVAPIAVLWVYRAEYRKMNFRFDVISVSAGMAVAALWIGAHHLQAIRPGSHVSAQNFAGDLAALSRVKFSLWVSCRVLAAVITVPIAEELAFRGFLARRLMTNDVEAMPYAQLSNMAIVLSAVCFGLMHGWMWGPGIASGLVFGLTAKFKNRIGAAVAAHATANLAIAAWVLLRSDYGLW